MAKVLNTDRAIRYFSLTRNIDAEGPLRELMARGMAGELAGIKSMLLRHGAGDINFNYFNKGSDGPFSRIKTIVTFNIDIDLSLIHI